MDLGKILRENYGIRGGLEVGIASIFVACSAIVLYAFSYVRTKRIIQSLTMVFVFAFCTSVWSTASRALWQHTSSLVLLSLVLLLLVWAREHPASAPVMIRMASVLLAFSYVVRPTNSLSILVFSVYVFIQYRKQFPVYCLWSLFVTIPFVAHNVVIYHALLPTYYVPQHQFDTPPPLCRSPHWPLIQPITRTFYLLPGAAVFGVWACPDNSQEADERS